VTTFRVEPRPFAAATAWVAKRLPTKPVVPVLSGMLLEFGEGLSVSGFDYDTASVVLLDIAGQGSGRAVVSARLLAALAATLPDKPVEVTMGDRVSIRCGGVKATLPTMPVEDYPALPKLPPVLGTVDADVFGLAVEQVAPAADVKGSAALAALTGMYLAFDANRITLMASDRYTGAVGEVPWTPGGPFELFGALVDATVALDVARLAHDGKELTIGLGDNLVSFSSAGWQMTARLMVADEFPSRLPSIMPARSETPAVVSVAELTTALKRADLVRADRLAPAQLAFDGTTVTVSASDSADAAGEVPCEYAGPPITIFINPGRLLPALAALHAPTVEISMVTPSKAVVLTIPDVSGYRHSIMPIRKD
jgi:DNA polymerase-3 subunit beta